MSYLIVHHSLYHSDHLTAVINLYTNKCVRIIGKVTNYWCVCMYMCVCNAYSCVSAMCTCTCTVSIHVHVYTISDYMHKAYRYMYMYIIIHVHVWEELKKPSQNHSNLVAMNHPMAGLGKKKPGVHTCAHIQCIYMTCTACTHTHTCRRRVFVSYS